MTVTIWHNPRCSKSRQTLAILEDQGITPTVRLYLEDAPTAAELKDVLGKLGLDARGLMRKGEADYKEQNLASVADDTTLIDAMAKTPKLIERPIVLSGGKAAVGRPPECVLAIL